MKAVSVLQPAFVTCTSRNKVREKEMTDDRPDQQVDLLDIVQKIVQNAAPDEMPLVESIRSGAGTKNDTKPGPLQFGIDLPDAFLTTLLVTFFVSFFSETGKQLGASLYAATKEVFSKRELAKDELSRYLKSKNVDQKVIEAVAEQYLKEVDKLKKEMG